MGYSADYFEAEVGRWLRQGWLKPGDRLIEFGAQEWYGSQTEAKTATAAFLRRRDVAEDVIDAVCGCSAPMSARNIWNAIKIDHTSIDVDGAHGSRYFDLNTFAPPLEWRAAFDFVNNEGTIEHLINPINGFQVTHELLKVGGIALHSIPLSGHVEHGMMYPSLKFYAVLLGANAYELLEGRILVRNTPFLLSDTRLALMDEAGQPIELAKTQMTNAWLRLIYRKTKPAAFRAPTDHLVVDDPAALAARLTGNFDAYTLARLTADRSGDPIRDEFERQAELKERDHRHARRLQAQHHDHADRLCHDLQQREHAHADRLCHDLQQRDHAHADRREHAHADRIDRISSPPVVVSSAPSIAFLAMLIAVALNAAALFLHEEPRFAFALGLALAFGPALLAWTDITTQNNRVGRLARHGSRALWLAAVGAFLVGQLSAPAS